MKVVTAPDIRRPFKPSDTNEKGSSRLPGWYGCSLGTPATLCQKMAVTAPSPTGAAGSKHQPGPPLKTKDSKHRSGLQGRPRQGRRDLESRDWAFLSVEQNSHTWTLSSPPTVPVSCPVLIQVTVTSCRLYLLSTQANPFPGPIRCPAPQLGCHSQRPTSFSAPSCPSLRCSVHILTTRSSYSASVSRALPHENSNRVGAVQNQACIGHSL